MKTTLSARKHMQMATYRLTLRQQMWTLYGCATSVVLNIPSTRHPIQQLRMHSYHEHLQFQLPSHCTWPVEKLWLHENKPAHLSLSPVPFQICAFVRQNGLSYTRVKLYNLFSILLIISGTFNKTAMEITFSVGKHNDDQPCVNTRQFQINLAYTLTALLQWRSTFASSRCRSFQCIRIASIQNCSLDPMRPRNVKLSKFVWKTRPPLPLSRLQFNCTFWVQLLNSSFSDSYNPSP